MTRKHWVHIGSIAAALGGLSWLAKVAVIIATDGKVNDEGAAAFFYLLGVALMAIGSTAVGSQLAGGRSWWVLAVAVALSPILLVVSFAILDGVTKPLVGDRGPTYWGDEAGILVTGVVWLMIGVGLFWIAHRTDGGGAIVHVRQAAGSGKMMTP
ncbi:MAG: hypothetical protein H0V37_05915 [Chloroflexia bacterium]|nr:hypothetical protein [Chloroflexia bacterium]